MTWIDIEKAKPVWGQVCVVYRGKLRKGCYCDLQKPLYEITSQWDCYITHWFPLPEDPVDKSVKSSS